ncbi:MAG: tetratricopeptide repeat protein [candidate division Zixibacteria bacterium]
MSSTRDDNDKTRSYIVLNAGTEVSHYKIIEKIGAGGMGEVYLAEDTELDRKVALKFLPPHLDQDDDCRTRFKREARAAARLSNPHIVVVHEVDEHKGRPFIVMEYVEGQSLKDIIKSGELPLKRVLEIGAQICIGLIKAHEAGITHRDIKPSNIIIDNDGCAKLLDFGLATIEGAEKITRTGSTTGTVGYMSPEQVRGEDVDHRADIFSLGVVLYEMVTGRLPFEGERDAAIIYSILNEKPKPLEGYRKNIPEVMQHLIDNALKKDVNNRYQAVVDLAIDLNSLSQELEFSSFPESQSGKRKRRVYYTGASFLLAVVVGLLLTSIIMPDKMKNLWRWLISSTERGICEIQVEQEPFVVVIAPFFGRSDEAIAEGTVMQALIEREILNQLGGEDDVIILGKDISEIPGTHEEAMALGEKHEASIVLWGEVIVLRGEVEIQPNITAVKHEQNPIGDASLTALEANLEEPNQLALRKSKASEVGDMALMVAARYHGKQDLEKSHEILDKISQPSIECFILRGDLLNQAGKRVQAIESYWKAYLLDTVSVRVAYKLGRYYSMQGMYDSALTILQKSLTHNPGNEMLQFQVAGAHSYAGQKELAATFLKNSITEYPDNERLRTHLGWALWRLGRVSEAITEHKKAIDTDPENGDSFYGLGWIYEFSDSLEMAILNYESAIRVGTNWWGEFAPHFTLGRVYSKQGEYEMAVASHCNALELYPWYVPNIRLLGEAYVELGKGDKALALFQQAETLNPENAQLHREYGELHKSLGDTAGAITEYQTAIALDYDNRMSYINLRRAYIQTGKSEEAIAWFNEVISQNPESRQLRLQYGRLFYDIGDTVNAIEQFKKLIQLDPEYGDAYYWLGWVSETNNSFDDAIEYYQKAAEYGTENNREVAVRSAIGRIYFKRGEYDKSVSELVDAIKVDPYFIGPYYYLWRAYYNLDKTEDAIPWFESAININPNNVYLRTYFAEVLSSLNDEVGAIREYKEVIRLDPDTRRFSTAAAYSNIAAIRANQGKYDELVNVIDKIKALQPLNAYNGLLFGMHYLSMGKYEDAASEYMESIRLDSTDVYSHLFYFLALYQAGRSEEAKEYLAQYSLTLEDRTWPAIITHFLNCNIDENALAVASEREYPNSTESKRKGEMYYYLGMSYLLNIGNNTKSSQPDTSMALEYLEKCLDHEKDNILEYRMAKAELKRLNDLGY